MKWSEFSNKLYQINSLENILDANPPMSEKQEKILEDFKRINEKSDYRTSVCNLSTNIDICSITRPV